MKPASPVKILVVLVILFVPAISYYFISKGKNNFKKLEIFGPKEISSPREVNGRTVFDTVYHTIPAFKFTDQFGRVFSEKSLEGNIYVADFFFTTCKTICPRMSRQMWRVQNKFEKDADVKIISVTVDPETDSVPVLAAYAQSYNAVKDKWFFLTGDKTQTYELARNGFFLAAIQGTKSPEEFNHSEQLVLIDKDRRIRGYYDGTDDMEVNKLLDEIQVLQWEYRPK